MGVKVKIMKPFDATGKFGISKPLPDFVEIMDPPKAGENDEEEIRTAQIPEDQVEGEVGEDIPAPVEATAE